MFSPKETMSVFLKEIRNISPEAARALEKADVRTDSEIQSLTQEDLRDLLPGHKNFKQRKSISELIHSQRPINALLADMKDFIPDEAFRDALTENGLLYHYLLILKGLKDQMNNVQAFLDAHIEILEKYTKNQDQTSDKGVFSGTSKSGTNAALGFSAAQTDANPSTTQACVPAESPRVVSRDPSAPPQKARVTVKFWSVVCGETFGCHKTLLNWVENVHELKLEESSCDQDSQIIFVFCPIITQPNADVKSAMSKTPAGKPVILVMMHHTHEPYHTTPRMNCQFSQNIVLDVNVLYHDSVRGLLRCAKNDQAVSQIQSTLLQHCNSKIDDGVFKGTSSLDTNAAVGFHAGQTDADPSATQACVPAESPGIVSRYPSVPPQKAPVTVKFWPVVSGETLGVHKTLLSWVENLGELKLVESSHFQDSQITFVFCPVSSRHLTDVESAMRETPADKPVILVILYHTRDPYHTTLRINVSQFKQNIVLDVNLLYHDSVRGLLRCAKNDQAVSQIQSTLLQHCSSKTDDGVFKGTSSLDTNAAVGFHAGQTDADPSATHGPVTVKFWSVVSGETFRCRKTLLNWVENVRELKLEESSCIQDSQIIFVFCPSGPQPNADVKSAMSKTPAGKPVILVMMRHTYDVSYTTPRITVSQFKQNIVLDVNVLYNSHGLLRCPENDEAVSQIHSTLLQHCSGKTDGGGGERFFSHWLFKRW